VICVYALPDAAPSAIPAAPAPIKNLRRGIHAREMGRSPAKLTSLLIYFFLSAAQDDEGRI
jgi:hypothetical protein